MLWPSLLKLICMHIMLKQSICYEYLYITWLLHTKNSYLKLYLHYQHCEFAFVIRYVYIYILRVVDRCLWKHERYIFLEKKIEKLILKETTLKNITVKLYLSHRMRVMLFFFTWDTNKLKTNLSIDRFNLQKISICIMNKLVS